MAGRRPEVSASRSRGCAGASHAEPPAPLTGSTLSRTRAGGHSGEEHRPEGGGGANGSSGAQDCETGRRGRLGVPGTRPQGWSRRGGSDGGPAPTHPDSWAARLTPRGRCPAESHGHVAMRCNAAWRGEGQQGRVPTGRVRPSPPPRALSPRQATFGSQRHLVLVSGAQRGGRTGMDLAGLPDGCRPAWHHACFLRATGPVPRGCVRNHLIAPTAVFPRPPAPACLAPVGSSSRLWVRLRGARLLCRSDPTYQQQRSAFAFL